MRERTYQETCKQPNRGNLTYYSPPFGGGAGGGASRFGGEAAVHSPLLCYPVFSYPRFPCLSHTPSNHEISHSEAAFLMSPDLEGVHAIGQRGDVQLVIVYGLCLDRAYSRPLQGKYNIMVGIRQLSSSRQTERVTIVGKQGDMRLSERNSVIALLQGRRLNAITTHSPHSEEEVRTDILQPQRLST